MGGKGYEININQGNPGERDVHLRLVYYAPEDHASNYIIRISPLPVSNYCGEVRVESPVNNRTRLSWGGTYPGK